MNAHSYTTVISNMVFKSFPKIFAVINLMFFDEHQSRLNENNKVIANSCFTRIQNRNV